MVLACGGHPTNACKAHWEVIYEWMISLFPSFQRLAKNAYLKSCQIFRILTKGLYFFSEALGVLHNHSWPRQAKVWGLRITRSRVQIGTLWKSCPLPAFCCSVLLLFPLLGFLFKRIKCTQDEQEHFWWFDTCSTPKKNSGKENGSENAWIGDWILWSQHGMVIFVLSSFY